MSKDNCIPVWNLSLHQIAVINAVKDAPPTFLERLGIKDYRKRVATDWGKRVAVFTSYQKACEYLDWSLHVENSSEDGRFKQESLLYGYDRAWVLSMWVDVPVDPKISMA